MHPFVHFLITGAAFRAPGGKKVRALILHTWKSDWVIRAFQVAALGLALSAGFHLLDRPDRIRGDWVDQAFSEVMSRRLAAQVLVQDVRFVDWTHIQFGASVLRDEGGRLLGFAGSGGIRLRQAGVRKDNFFETEIRLTDTTLTPEYYRKARRQKIWARLMRKPLLIRQLTARVRQNDAQTVVKITECHSRDINLEGELIYRHSGSTEDHLQATMSPWRFLSAVF